MFWAVKSFGLWPVFGACTALGRPKASKAHWVQNIETLHPFHPGNNISMRCNLQGAPREAPDLMDMETYQCIKLRFWFIIISFKSFMFFPIMLPFSFNNTVIVSQTNTLPFSCRTKWKLKKSLQETNVSCRTEFPRYHLTFPHTRALIIS